MILNSSIRDNKNRGSVGDFLKTNITKNSNLAIVSAYFTIYAFEKISNELNSIKNLKFLFGEPTFIKGINPKDDLKRDYKIEDEKLVLPLEYILQQKNIAKNVLIGLVKKSKLNQWLNQIFFTENYII